MNKTYFGDCRTILSDLKGSGFKAQMCVTSPPYFGLRDYKVDGQIGLEKTPQAYVDELVDVFRKVRDVLADDGTLWLNLGDSYAANRSYQVTPTKWKGLEFGESNASTVPEGFKPKDLIGIPWRVALALQADGWYLRQDIIWHKPNAMPESVKDRCTKAHEYVFLLSKSERYFFDSGAMQEPAAKGYNGSTFDKGKTAEHQLGRCSSGVRKDTLTRNRRSVWTIPTKPYKGAHFAVFPPALIEPCVLAGSRCGDVVLDPFMGSGTTAEVALTHGRQYVGCELNPSYEELQTLRLAKVVA